MIEAKFFDILGLIVFASLFGISLKIIKNKKLRYHGYTILLISLIGIIMDGYSVITNFIL